MPEAARISDLHVCPKVEGGAPHVGGPIFAGSANVIIGFLPAARVGDAMVCFPVGPTDSIKAGATTVLINYVGAARKTDPGSHIAGDIIVRGCPSVLIGDTPQSFALRQAAARGTPFCEECKRKQTGDDPAEMAAPADEADTVTLADENPPQGRADVMTPTPGVSREELAKQSDAGDALDDVRRAARQAVAYRFYADKAGLAATPAKIWSHIAGVDVAKPVEVVDVGGATVYQRGFPGGKNGEYFALDPKVTPEQLGASTLVGVVDAGVRKLVPRDRRVVKLASKVIPALKSTASPIQDTWSIRAHASDPGQIVACEGGGTQIMIPRDYHGGSDTKIGAGA